MSPLVTITSRKDAQCHYGIHSHIGPLVLAWKQAEQSARIATAAMKPAKRQRWLQAVQTARQQALDAIRDLIPYEVDVREAFKQPLLPPMVEK